MSQMSRSGLRRIRSEERDWLKKPLSRNTFICYEESEGAVYIIYYKPVKYVKQIYFKLIMGENYPFAKPGIVYSMDLENWREMRKFYELRNRGMVRRFKGTTGLECMCCVSIICGDNWKVQTKMKEIAKEIERFMEIKERMNNRLLLEIISRRDVRLPDDIWNYIIEYI